MKFPFSLGCNGRGVVHVEGTPTSVDEQFRMVKAAGVFDHFDRMPQPGEEREYLEASQRHGIPIRTGLWWYTAGKDEKLLEKNLRVSMEGGAEFHDVMLHIRHDRGTVVTDDEIVDFYLLAHELGERIGIEIGFENHIYMWSEDPRRIEPIAERIRQEGIPFKFVLDHSHVLIKLDNPEEQDIIGIRDDVESGALIIDPYQDGNVLDRWIATNTVHWLQVRPVSPAGPKNIWAIKDNNSYAGGSYGRPCQYPFVRPHPGEWHSQWHAYRVEPAKEIVRRMFRHHRDTPGSPLRYLTADMIDMADYGENAKYSLFDQNVAIARWLRSTWDSIAAESPRSLPATVTPSALENTK
ncbi:xylose isomerase [Hydrogenophaga sp. 2FB]|uniref:xylose isomerase n=1 Tax=Hydrogenophaga sp. 2FB TaxID=2502187 RepID=UPI0010F64934|nr:xylose isomerase [Hydrogenophaga sp. 2FB]